MRVEPDDRLDADVFALFIKLDSAVEVVEVGERERLASLLLGPRDQLGDFWQSFEQRVVRVHVEMYELRGHKPSITLACPLERGALMWW